MSENNSIKFPWRRVLAVIFTLAAILFGCVSAITSLAFVNIQNPFAGIIVNIPFLLISVLLLVLSAMTVGHIVLFVAILPAFLAIPYIASEPQGAVAIAMSALSVLVCAQIMYRMYKGNAKSSAICPAVSFAAIICEILRYVLLILVEASGSGRKFSTVLFERLGGIIDETVSYITYMFDAASSLYPGLEQSLTGAEINLLRASMSMSVSLMPALITCIFFFLVLLLVVILNSYNKKTNVLPDRTYEIYSVDRPCYIIFNILTVVYILNFFFGSGFGGFFVGLMSALMFMFPHFALLAYRRLYYSLIKNCGEFFTIIIILAITGLGFVFSIQLLFWVLVFFGTAEYRAQEFAKRNGNGEL